MKSASEQTQQDHYNRIAAEYAAHYGDAWSQVYRRRFINIPAFAGIPLQGAQVLEAMSGSGATTAFLKERGAIVSALDISEEEIARFRELWSDCDAHCVSILNTGLPDNAYDVVVVMGGLHHVHPHLNEAVREIHRILKPGGYFCFVEPHKGAFLDVLRRHWYRADRYFLENEESIDLCQMQVDFSRSFEFIRETFGGNIAYLLVLNSLVLRVPLWLKPFISPFAIWVESWVRVLQGKTTSCFVIGQWRKRNHEIL